jgi:hypothetical protein
MGPRTVKKVGILRVRVVEEDQEVAAVGAVRLVGAEVDQGNRVIRNSWKMALE